MIPEETVSSIPVTAPILGGRALTGTLKWDFEDGPVEFNDTSLGLYYQIWSAFSYESGVRFYDSNGIPTEVLAAINITEISFTFDQNGRPAIAFVQYGQGKIWWFDSSLGAVTTTVIGYGITSPKIILDDKRQTQTDNSDIIMGYIRGGNLCYRQQRDRFTIEKVLANNVVGRIQKIGMGNNLRLQFVVGNY